MIHHLEEGVYMVKMERQRSHKHKSEAAVVSRDRAGRAQEEAWDSSEGAQVVTDAPCVLEPQDIFILIMYS